MANDLFNTEPFAELGSYRDALRQLVEGGWVAPRDLLPSAVTSVVIPIDLMDTGADIVLQTNLPGVKPEDVSVSITGSILTIKGNMQEINDFQGATYIRRERRAASFARSVSLPVAVDAEKAQAQIKNGVLTLTLPKTEAVRPKNIIVSA